MSDERLYPIRLIHEGVKYSAVGFFNRDNVLVVGAERIEGELMNWMNDYSIDDIYDAKFLLTKQFYKHYPELKK